MKRLSFLLTVAISVTAFFALTAGAASAETFGVLCKSQPANNECVSRYAPGTEVTATLVPGTNLKVTSSGVTVNQCAESTLKFQYNGESGLEYLGSSFSACSKITKGAFPGEAVLKWKENSDNGTVNWAGKFFEMQNAGLYGTYGLSGAGIELVGGSSPKINFAKAPLVPISGSTLSGLVMSGEYTLSPSPIYVEKPAVSGVLCKTAPVGNHCASSEYAAGSEFTATLAAGTTVLVKGPFGEFLANCKKSSIQFKYQDVSGFEYLKAHELKYVSSSYSECSSGTMTDVSAGGLVIKFREGTTEVLGGVGQLFQLNSNLYGPLGNYGLTGAGARLIQGASPQLELVNAKLVGPPTGFPTGATMSGRYNLSPTPLYVGEA